MNKLSLFITKNEEGAALLYTIIILVLFSVIAVSFISLAAAERIIAVNEKQSTKAFYLAESGVENALALLNRDADTEEDFDFYIGENLVQVELDSYDSDKIRIISQAAVSGISRAVVVELEKSPFMNVLFSFGVNDITSEISESCDLDGNVMLNHDLSIGDGSAFHERLLYFEESELNYNEEEVYFEYPTKTFSEPAEGGEEIIDDYLDFVVDEENAYIIEDDVTDLEVFDNEDYDTFIVYGDVDLGRNVYLADVTIRVVDGHFKTEGNLGHPNPIENVHLMVDGDVELGIKNNSSFSNSKILTKSNLTIGSNSISINSLFVAGEDMELGDRAGQTRQTGQPGPPENGLSALLASRGEFSVGSNSEITGSIVAEYFDIGRNTSIIHDQEIIQELEDVNLFRIVNWSEN